MPDHVLSIDSIMEILVYPDNVWAPDVNFKITFLNNKNKLPSS